MNILLTGSHGLIGTALQTKLAGDHNITTLIRRTPQTNNEFFWNPQAQHIDETALNDCNAVIHLAGPSIAAKRWSDKRKAYMHTTRVTMVKILGDAIKASKTPPKTLIIASAIGYYDKEDPTTKTEDAKNGSGFDAKMCHAIENTLDPKDFPNTRIIYLRIGIVLSPKGGALKKLLPPFYLGGGGKLGSGNQPFPWISLTDVTSAITFCMENEKLSGPVNLTAPAEDTNLTFTKTLGKVINRPTILPLPAFMVKLMFGEMGEELLLKGTHVTPKKLQKQNFRFQYPTLEEALRTELKR